MSEYFVLSSNGTLHNTNDITDLRHIPELNLEGGCGLYVNLRKGLDKLNTYEEKINFVGDQITRYKSAIQRRNPQGLPQYQYTIDMLLKMSLIDLYEKYDELNNRPQQLSLL